MALLAGCGQVKETTVVSAGRTVNFKLAGKLRGGQQPVAGSSIQLYGMNFGLDGTAATPILATPAVSDANGNFNLTGTYTCPASDPFTYIVATGGNPGLGEAKNNPNIAAMALADVCVALPNMYINIDEVTTAATVVTYGQYMSSFPNIGFNSTNNAASYDTWARDYLAVVDPTTGTSPGPKFDGSQVFPFSKLYLLANVMASCVNSAGGVAGDKTPCGNLFALATPPGGTAPTNTVDALLDIWRNPTQNVMAIANLTTPASPFQPQLSAPTDFYVRMGTTATPRFFQCTTYGDSLTEGSEDGSSVTIAKQLATLPSCYTGNNQGVGGNDAAEIAIREGGLASTGTVQGGVIPAAGPVNVAFPKSMAPVTANGPYVLKVNFNGVDGFLSYNYGNGQGTFTRTNAGVAVNSPADSSYTVDPGTQNQGFLLIWAGRNNLGDTQMTLTSIAAMVASLPAPKHFLVLSLTNTTQPNEQLGQPGYNTLIQTNQALQQAYPNNYLDIRAPVIAGYDPTNAEDVIDQQLDVPPSTMRAIDDYGSLTAALDATSCKMQGQPNTFPGFYTIQMEQEKILITDSDATTVTQCVRGYAGTVAVAHANGTAYTGRDAVHLDAEADILIARLVDQWIQANY